MSQDDFYVRSGARQMQVLQAARAAQLADLESHRLNNDAESAAESVQVLANLDAQMRDLNALYQQYQAASAPPPQPTDEERAAKPLHRMDYSDVYSMLKNSKYGVDHDAFRAGVAEVQRRRARGE
jgi:hypothetical protein